MWVKGIVRPFEFGGVWLGSLDPVLALSKKSKWTAGLIESSASQFLKSITAFFPTRKFQKMTYYERPNIGRKLIENGQIPTDDFIKLFRSRLATSRNLKGGFDETSSLKPSIGDERFQLVISQNWFLNWLSSHFDWTKTKKSLKGHGNEADFLGFLQKLVPHRSLTLPFEPFRFWSRGVAMVSRGVSIRIF